MDRRSIEAPGPYVVGLTGGIGSGKSAAADTFAALGASIVDADLIARDVVAPNSEGLAAITEKFGHSVLLPDGHLNREKLRTIIFASPPLREWLNRLIHPMVRLRMQEAVSKPCDTYVLLVVPLLIENGLMGQCHRVLVIDCDEQQQLLRAQKRDNSSYQTVRHIMSAQLSRRDRLVHADDIIDNSTDFDALKQQVTRLHTQYLLNARNRLT